MADTLPMTAFNAFESQLKTLCLQEFPCGIGRWKENYGKKRKQIEKDKVNSRYVVTLKDYGASYDKTETLEELVIVKDSPWNLDYSWSNEAKQLREIAVRSPWLIDDRFVLSHFKTLRIVDKDVTEVDEHFLKFCQLEELSLSANRIRTVNSSNLPSSLQVLELCANSISNLADLCMRPPPKLRHLGLGYNSISLVDEYITGEFWPNLLSLDLTHNNLCDLMDIVRKLQTLPKLRNLILQGNPLTLIPGYRGYTIDSLRKLSFLDDISISADEKHHYKGLAKRKEYILDEAKVVFHVSYIKGVPMPDEIKIPEEQPEFPVVTRKYFVQFTYIEDKSTDPEIFEIIHDDNMSEISPSTLATQKPVKEVTPTVNTARTSEGDQGMGLPEEGNNDVTDSQDVPIFMVTAPTEAGRGEHRPGSQQTSLTVSATATGDEPAPLMPAYSLAPVNSASSEWAEDIQLNWTKTVCRDDLQGCRDFLKEGMKICVMEEKIDSYPADQFQTDEPVSPAPSSKSKDGKKDKGDKKADKKDDKAKDKGKDDKASKEEHKGKRKNSADQAKGGDKGGDKKGKKKGEPEVEMVAMAPEYKTLCTFHVPLADFLDGEFEFENVYSYSGFSQLGSATPASEISSKNKVPKNEEKPKEKRKDSAEKVPKKEEKKEKKKDSAEKVPKKEEKKEKKKDSAEKSKDKDKKKPGSAKKKDAKPEKDARVKSGKKDEKKDKKDDKGGKGKDGKLEADEEASTPPPPLEIHVRVKLDHWRTAMDSMKAEEGSEEPEAGGEEQ